MDNLATWLFEAADPSAAAVWDHGRWFSYAELHQRVRAIAAHVRDRARAGTHGGAPIIPIVGDNSFHHVAAYLGVLAAGGIPTLLPPMADAATAEILRETAATLVLCDPRLLERTQAHGVPTSPYDTSWASELHSPRTVEPDDLAVLLYTSGSTGQPRGVMLSARNIRFNTAAILDFLPLVVGDRALVTLPFYYCYGLSVLHTHLVRGAAVVLNRDGLAEPTLDLAEEVGATGVPGVPSLFHSLTSRGALAARTLPALRYFMISGGRVAESVIRDLRAACPHSQVFIRYGITEVTAAASYLPPDRLDDKAGSIGRGLPAAPLAVEDADGVPVVPGSDTVGEIVVRGDHVSAGYFGDRGDGGFRDKTYRTGDLARVDAEGFVFVVGRSKEFVKTGGHRVSPDEIEEVIARIADVQEVGVFGEPHAMRGEALIAVVVMRPGRSMTTLELKQHCAAQLPAFKLPVEYRFADALPKRPNGKLDRRALALTQRR